MMRPATIERWRSHLRTVQLPYPIAYPDSLSTILGELATGHAYIAAKRPPTAQEVQHAAELRAAAVVQYADVDAEYAPWAFAEIAAWRATVAWPADRCARPADRRRARVLRRRQP